MQRLNIAMSDSRIFRQEQMKGARELRIIMLWVDGCVAGEKERKVKIYPSNLDKNPSQ
jgi:hypothetical protein